MKPQIDIQKYKMVVFDLDGTIIDADQPIHPFTVEVIKKLPGLGIQFTLASGRNMASIDIYAEELGVDLPMILDNGSLLQSLNGKIYHRNTIPAETTKKIVEITDREGSDLVAFIDEKLYFKKMTDNIARIFGWLDNSKFKTGAWEAIEPMFDQVNKLMVVDWESVDRLKTLERIFGLELDGKADYLLSNIHHLDIMPKNVSKATGLIKLGEILDIRMEEIIAFGDYDNDAAMLAEVGLGVAVADASDLAKQNADMITGSCADNGPAHFLDELMR